MSHLCAVFFKVILFYQLFAYHCFYFVSGRLNNRKKNPCFTIYNVSLTATLFCWIFQHQSLVLFTDNIQGYLIDLFKLLLIAFSYYAILLECWLGSGCVVRLWNEFDEMYQLITSPRWARLPRTHFITVTSFMVFMSFWEFTYAYGVASTSRATNFTIAFWLLFALIHLRQLQILLYTDLLRFCLTEMNDQLRWSIELSKAASRYGGPRTDGQIHGHIRRLLDGFVRCYRLLVTINRAFGCSLIIIKIITHVYLLTDCYWIVFGIMRHDLRRSLAVVLIVEDKHHCRLLGVHSCEWIVLECARTRQLLHQIDLGWQLRNERGWEVVRAFLQLLDSADPVSVNAMNLFKMDYSIVMAIIVHVATSISIFIQATG
uniref:Gustatory receptor n=1 Tax=Anopheles albimanus TaxID=7167 RepID=A0A182FZX3_ANOAL